MDWDKRKQKSPPDQSTPDRRNPQSVPSDEVALVRLIRKYANVIDGVSLERVEVGDRFELPRRDAEVLIAEGWVERIADERRVVRLLPGRALAADSSRSRRKPKA